MDDFEERFNQLVSAWHNETCYLSDCSVIINNYNCQKIIAMGELVVPLILRKLKNNDPMCLFEFFGVLQEITGEWPVPKEYAGYYCQIKDCWIAWGENKGLI
jgi:hypothetical protein